MPATKIAGIHFRRTFAEGGENPLIHAFMAGRNFGLR